MAEKPKEKEATLREILREELVILVMEARKQDAWKKSAGQKRVLW